MGVSNQTRIRRTTIFVRGLRESRERDKHEQGVNAVRIAIRRTAAILVGILFWAGAGASLGVAQETSVVLRARGGPALVAGEFSDVVDIGGAVGGSVSYRFHPAFEARLDVSGERLDDRSDQRRMLISPPVTLVHFHGGIGVELPRPDWQHQPLTFGLNVGGGATVMSSDGMVRAPTTGEETGFSFQETYPSLHAGAELGYELSPRVEVFASGQTYLTFLPAEDTDAFAERSPAVQRFGHAWTFPVTAGIRLNLR